MKFLIEPLDLDTDLSKVLDEDVLNRLGCSDGSGCCSGKPVQTKED
jgi:hypothetical protein